MQQNAGGPQSQMGQQLRPVAAELGPGQPVLYLLSLNGTFERKTIAVPFAPESLRIGRQTNQKTVPTPTNGFFDSKVLSRQHAEIYAERNGKIFIRDVKSSNGTFVNGTRLSQENRESEPHELQTADHLELGIDIVSEDQKTVVHHKVAAKVEHAGFMSVTNNVLDMNFGDLDPANGSTMLSGVALQMRGRNGPNAPMANHGRPIQNGPINQQANNMLQQRPFFMAPIATDQIMKRLTAEMRSARLQAQDLGRTNQFLSTLLSKDDLKELDNHDAAEAQKLQPVNGNAIALRPDTKARFSDPPAPPPQQPLPEKPDSPAPKRGLSDRPKSGHSLTSPIKQDNLSQIIQLTEALNNAKRDIDFQAARNRELEELLQQERQAREVAEGLARQLEESTSTQVNDSTKAEEAPEHVDKEMPVAGTDAPIEEGEQVQTVDTSASIEKAALFESRILTMESQMEEMKQQLSQWQKRCEAAETERDSSRKSLEEMVVQLRAEEARRKESEKAAQSKPFAQKLPNPSASTNGKPVFTTEEATEKEPPSHRSSISDDSPTLSRTNTITPQNANMGFNAHGQQYHASLPYASMLGVVLIGMGMMAYMNGWQAPPPPTADR